MLAVLRASVLLLPMALVSGATHAKTPAEALGWGLMILAGGMAGLWISHRIGTPEDVLALQATFLGAFAVRLMTSVATNYWAPPWWFAEDDGLYHETGWKLAQFWHGDLSRMPVLQGEPGFYYILGAIYSVFGKALLTGLAFNALAGALLCIIVYRVALEYTNSSTIACRAAQLVALLPSLVLWSSLLLRDVWVTLLIALSILCMLRVNNGRLSAIPWLVICTILVGQFRSYILLALGVAILMAMSLPGQKGTVGSFALRLVGVMVLFGIFFGLRLHEQVGDTVSPERLTQARQALATGGSAYLGDVRFRSIGEAVLFAPVGVLYFLLGPFPWMIKSARQAIVLPDLAILYWCLIPAIQAVRSSWRWDSRSTACLVAPVASIVVGYGLVSANMGTAFRHRAQVLPPILVLGAVGLEMRRRRHGQMAQKRSVEPVPGRPLPARSVRVR